MWIVNGEIDFQGRHVDFGNYTLFKENESKGDYAVVLGVSSYHTCFTPNHATKEDRLREFFQDRKVRIALSHAADREEINELVYNGVAKPRQYSPLEESPQYYPKLSDAYLDYDPEKANSLLDEAGYGDKDGDGFRLWKDGSGEPIFFTIEGIDQAGSPGEDHVQMLTRYYEDVGIKCAYRYVERSLYTEHFRANDIEAAWVIWNNRTVLPIVTPWIFIGSAIDHAWCCGWGIYWSNPEDPNAVAPPEGHWMWGIWDAYDRMVLEPDEDKRNEIFTEILDIWAEELPQVGYLGEFPTAIIVKNGLRNYLPGYPTDDIGKDENLLNTQALFWDEPEKHT
jgi:peptide/nickel transport system substrate-binding protein